MLLKDVINATEAIGKIVEVPLKTKVSFQFGIMLDKMAKPYNEFKEQRDKLIHKHGELKGENYSVKEENYNEYFKELDELLNTDIEINEKIALSDIEDVQIEGIYILMLKPFITT